MTASSYEKHVQTVLALFRDHDGTGKGLMSKETLTRLFLRMMPERSGDEISELFDQAGIASDAQVNYTTFLNWLFFSDDILEYPQADRYEDTRENPSCNRYSQEDAYEDVQPPHLVLYFDINKTVLMTDQIHGKTAERVVNETLANTSWGIEAEGSWILQVHEPSVLRPDPSFVSYVEWVQRLYPGRENNKLRNEMNGSFTHAGKPGEKLKPFAEQLISALTTPDGTEIRLIPSFLRLLLYLKQAGRSFCLCFRTFGVDLHDVAEELNKFCEGRHPLFPGVTMDGTDGMPDYRLPTSDIRHIGTFYFDEDQLCLVLGTVDQPGEGRFKNEIPSLGFYKEGFPDKKLQIICGTQAVRKWMWENTQKCGSLGIRDYFQYWKRKKMKSEGGKPFFFHPTRTVGVHQMFFDDNILYHDAHIVHAVDMRFPEKHQFISALLQTHLCRAEPLEAIRDPAYFIKQVARLEAGYARKLAASERLRDTMMKISTNVARLATTCPEQNTFVPYDAWRDFRTAAAVVSLNEDDDQTEESFYDPGSPMFGRKASSTLFGPKNSMPMSPTKSMPMNSMSSVSSKNSRSNSIAMAALDAMSRTSEGRRKSL